MTMRVVPGGYDIVVIGAGPAGLAAALQARQHDLSVLVIERHPFPRPRTFPSWLGPAAVAIAQGWGVDAEVAQASPFNGVTLYGWDFEQSARAEGADLQGWVVDRAAFDQALHDVAVERGAEVRHGVSATGLELGEAQATVTLDDGDSVSGGIVLLAGGAGPHANLLSDVTPAAHVAPSVRCVQMVAPVKDATPGLDIVLGQSRTQHLATVLRGTDAVRVTLAGQDAPPVLLGALEEFCTRAVRAGVLPALPDEMPATGVSPAGVALEMDSHVGKRTMLIGDAGGFVAAFSNEGVYPAMKSGCIAADVAARALGSELLQDELLLFGAAWRQELADYLRMPNTDLTLLGPLVLNNPQMTQRVARAFLLGQTL